MLIAAAGIGLGIILSGSRGAWAGALAGLLMFFLVTFRPRPGQIIAAACGALALLGAVLLIPDGFILGRFDMTDWSTQQRLLILFTAWDGITRSPLLGWGPGSFEHMLPAIARRGLYDDVAMPHNIVLDIWFELGLLALICFITLCTACIAKAARAYRRTHDVRIAGLLAGIVAMIAAAMFGSLFIRGVQEMFILLIALIAALIHGHDSDTSSQHSNADSLPV
jgi:O-antigen ligase